MSTPEQQYRVIADRDKGDDPQDSDWTDGDRVTFIAGGPLVRIERPEQGSAEEDFRYTIFDQCFEPSVVDLAREERNIKVSDPFGEAPRERTQSEQDEALAASIVKAEHRLVTLRYLQAVREARETDQGWLRKTLGWTRR